ncbi:MAG TPA: heavy metal-binding domain-containing protein [Burkholderiaceae bacterium]
MTHSAKTRSLPISGLDGNEAYCLGLQGFAPGALLVGNSVQSMGFLGGMAAGVRNLAGGESRSVTEAIKAGRDAALQRMSAEARQVGAQGVAGVSSELRSFGGHIEFLSTGSALSGQAAAGAREPFTSSFDGKALYCAQDAGYVPIRFAFGNIAYSVGIARGLLGGLKTLVRGEIREFSDVLNRTRHAALERIATEARQAGGNAVLGLEIELRPFAGFHEMLVTGTVARHPALPAGGEPATCDLACDELWSLARQGWAPIRVVMSTAVYSLGIVGGIASALRSLRRGELPELTGMVYDAREHALDGLEAEARACGAERVMGTDVYIHELGNGLVEFMAVGTAMRRAEGVRPAHDALPAQAVALHRSTFRSSRDDLLAGRVVTR